jgi:hypothetical protein
MCSILSTAISNLMGLAALYGVQDIPAGTIPPGCNYQSLQAGICAFLVSQLSASQSTIPTICLVGQHLLTLSVSSLGYKVPSKARWFPPRFTPCRDLLQAGLVPVRSTISMATSAISVIALRCRKMV